MMLVADESVDFTIIEQLRVSGIEVFAIVEKTPSLADDDVLNIAVKLKAPLLTEDKDFGELVFRMKLPHQGIILLRLGAIPQDKRGGIVAQVLLDHFAELKMAFVVFDGFKLRIRQGH